MVIVKRGADGVLPGKQALERGRPQLLIWYGQDPSIRQRPTLGRKAAWPNLLHRGRFRGSGFRGRDTINTFAHPASQWLSLTSRRFGPRWPIGWGHAGG